ncbi:MAG: hypothetical protein LW630_09370 [Saprospiraceae bacterium]|jgi:hypothetical protein|nr:hypothetical protein [Saprospiraceae bacterium]
MDKDTFLTYMDDYLDGQLTGPVLDEFTDMLANDTELSSELELHKLLRAKIRNAARNAFREKLRAIQEEVVESSVILYSMEYSAQQSAGIDREQADLDKKFFAENRITPNMQETKKARFQKYKKMWITAIAAVFILGISVIFLYKNSQTIDEAPGTEDSVVMMEKASENYKLNDLRSDSAIVNDFLKKIPTNRKTKILYSGQIAVLPSADEEEIAGKSMEMYIKVFENKEASAMLDFDTLLVFLTAREQRRIDWKRAKIQLNKKSLDIVLPDEKNITIPWIK